MSEKFRTWNSFRVDNGTKGVLQNDHWEAGPMLLTGEVFDGAS
jgi:hypothetical protein